MFPQGSLLSGLRVGTDITRRTRFIFDGRQSRVRNLARKILHPLEVESLRVNNVNVYNYLFGGTGSVERGSFWLSGRWAAKEAAKKAWGASILGWKDVRVQTNSYSPDVSGGVAIICQPAELYQEGQLDHETAPMQKGLLSISHDGDYAVATVIAEPLSEEMLAVIDKYRKPKLETDITATLGELEKRVR